MLQVGSQMPGKFAVGTDDVVIGGGDDENDGRLQHERKVVTPSRS